ncbi:unnamed protein product [Ilex paraguariensis]|uniref:Uncharacterized protein n=1 Tax=Ilex paraguariensis TaxID=185542 RepID=A0ABC8SE38_9AQUA
MSQRRGVGGAAPEPPGLMITGGGGGDGSLAMARRYAHIIYFFSFTSTSLLLQGTVAYNLKNGKSSATLSTELKAQAPIPLHPPLKKCKKITPTRQPRLRKLEPEEGHEDESRVVEELEKRESPTLQNGEECTECLKELREIEDIGPEEDASRRACSEWETKEPLEWGFRAPPEPPGVADLGGCRGESSCKDGGGDECHDEAVEGRDGAQWDGAAAAEEEEEVVEGGGGGYVGGDGDEEE